MPKKKSPPAEPHDLEAEHVEAGLYARVLKNMAQRATAKRVLAETDNPREALRVLGLTGGAESKGRRVDRDAEARLYETLTTRADLFGVDVVDPVAVLAELAEMAAETARTGRPASRVRKRDRDDMIRGLPRSPSDALAIVAKAFRRSPRAVLHDLRAENRKRRRAGASPLDLPKAP